MTEITVRVLADSINEAGDRITSLLARYQRFFHSELMTHKDLSRNAASSRAIPFLKQCAAIWKDPAEPLIWLSNQPGMQGGDELKGFRRWWCRSIWLLTGQIVLIMAWLMHLAQPHKQHINRMMEPWSHISVQITATNWDRMLKLRKDNAAQPEFQELARLIQLALDDSKPRLLKEGDWHMPWIRDYEFTAYTPQELLCLSVARSARLSYAVHGEPTMTSVDKDMQRYARLMDSGHWSCFEHQATPKKGQHANMTGWQLLRTQLEASDIPLVRPIV